MSFPIPSSLIQTSNLTVQSEAIHIAPAIIDGEEVNHTDIVTVNGNFDVFIRPIDRLTRLPLAKVQWSNWTWHGNVTLSLLPKFNGAGFLAASTNRSLTIDFTNNIIRMKDLSINATGMYVLNIHLMSTNGQHSINIRSQAILVVENDESLLTDTENFLCNITYTLAITTREWMISQAMIYNHLRKVDMPLISSITLISGE